MIDRRSHIARLALPDVHRTIPLQGAQWPLSHRSRRDGHRNAGTPLPGHASPRNRKLHGVSESPAAVAIAYATEAITRPEPRDPETLFLPREQRDLVPLIARGLTPGQMVNELSPKPDVAVVRRDCRELRVNLRALSRVNLVSRAWEYKVLTAEQVTSWLR